MEEEKDLLPIPNREKWDNVHQIFYQRKLIDQQPSLFDESDDTQKGV